MQTEDARRRRRARKLPPHPNFSGNENTPETLGFRSSSHRVHKKRICFLCYYCGYTPRSKKILLGDALCPKCGKSAWEKTEIPIRLFREPIDIS